MKKAYFGLSKDKKSVVFYAPKFRVKAGQTGPRLI